MWPFLQDLPSRDDFRSENLLGSVPTAGLYILLREDVIVYVGHSSHLQSRLRTHRREATKDFDQAIWYHVAEESSRLRLEGILILGLLPAYNRGLNLGMSRGRVWEVKWPSSSPRRRRGAGS